MKRAGLITVLFILVGSIGWAQIIDDIFDAISYGTVDDVRSIIERGVDINQPRHEYGVTPLQIAARDSDDPEKFRLLLNAGAQIDPIKYYDFDTPFELILKKNNIELVRLFIDAGADIHRIDNWGKTPLEYAASYSRDTAILRLLIEKGADIHNGGSLSTPLHSAAASNNLQNITLLIELGADINARDRGGEFTSPQGTGISQIGGNTPLMRGAISYRCVDILLKAGANINLQNNEGKTALILAAQYGRDPRVITLLLQNGANAKLEDNTGRTALDWFDLNRRINQSTVRRELRDRT
jgi:ankyrin repeat protein